MPDAHSRQLLIGKRCHIQLIVLSEFEFRIWSKHIMVKIARINIEFMWTFGFYCGRFGKFNGFIVGWDIFMHCRARETKKPMLENLLVTEITWNNLMGIFMCMLQATLYRAPIFTPFFF